MTKAPKNTYQNQPPIESLKGADIYDHLLPSGIRLGDATRKDLLAAIEHLKGEIHKSSVLMETLAQAERHMVAGQGPAKEG